MQTSSRNITRSWAIFDLLRRDSQMNHACFLAANSNYRNVDANSDWFHFVIHDALLTGVYSTSNVRCAVSKPGLVLKYPWPPAVCRFSYLYRGVAWFSARQHYVSSLSLSLSLSQTRGFLRITGRNRAVCIEFRPKIGALGGRRMPNEIEMASVRAFIGSVNGDDVRFRV